MNFFLKPCYSELIALFVSASLSKLSCIILSSSLITWLVSDIGLKLLHLFREPILWIGITFASPQSYGIWLVCMDLLNI